MERSFCLFSRGGIESVSSEHRVTSSWLAPCPPPLQDDFEKLARDEINNPKNKVT